MIIKKYIRNTWFFESYIYTYSKFMYSQLFSFNTA